MKQVGDLVASALKEYEESLSITLEESDVVNQILINLILPLSAVEDKDNVAFRINGIQPFDVDVV